jgi:hypothetical protein
MTCIKTCEKSYTKTGLKKPVFLWDDIGRKRVFIDVPKGMKAHIQYCYDKLKKGEENDARIKWHNYETGMLTCDFAFEIIGITALRVNVQSAHNAQLKAPVKLDIYQQNEMIEMS